MAAMLERVKVKGVPLKIAKSMICVAEVKWFGQDTTHHAGRSTRDYRRCESPLAGRGIQC